MSTTEKKPRGRKKADTGDTRSRSVDSMFSATLKAAQEQFGNGVAVGSADTVSQVGLPLPALSLRYLLQSTIFPLSRICQLAGQEGSCKTGLMLEILRWHLLYGGGGTIFENEHKDSEVLRNGMLDYRADWIEQFTKTIHTTSLNDWQKGLTEQLKLFAEEMDKKDGPGRTIPLLFAVDSLTATDTQNNIDKINADGFASRGYAEQAGMIAKYARSLPEKMHGYPFTLVATNHLKPATDFMGRPCSTIPGGKAVPFMATYLLESKREGDIDTADYQGIRVHLKLAKNSLGASRRSISVDFIWWWETHPETGISRQRFLWDWHTATVETIQMFASTKMAGKKGVYNQICDITGLKTEKKRAWSDVLGIGKDDAVSYRDWSMALETRPDLLEQLYPLMGIGKYRYFQPGMDFKILQDEQKAAAIAAGAPVYADPENLPNVNDDLYDEEAADTAADSGEGVDES